MKSWILRRRLLPYKKVPRPGLGVTVPGTGKSLGWLLVVGMGVSLSLHGLAAVGLRTDEGKKHKKSIMVPIVVSKRASARPRPAPSRPQARPPQKPVEHTHAYVKTHHTARPRPTQTHRAKPPQRVFGVTKYSLAKGPGASVAVRVGNTLMKEQEKTYTPPAKVRDLPEEQQASPPPPPTPRPRPRPRKPKIYDLRDVATKPAFAHRVAPRYTDAAQDAEVEGVVKVEVILNRQGQPIKVRVVKSLGHGLDEVVIRAVRASRFRPAQVRGRPVPCRLIIPYRFRLDD